MGKIKFIKKFKANFIRFKMHKLLGFSADYLIYLGQLIRLSKWADENKKHLKYNDFYNSNAKHGERFKFYEFLKNEEALADEAVNYIEFGVARGNALRWWSENNRNANSSYYAFDTYEGLPEDWGSYKKGTFSTEGKFPDIDDDRIEFVKGLFQDTLLDIVKKIDFSKKTIVHMDGDLYSSTLFPLTVLQRELKKDDILLYDEFGTPIDEFRAHSDFLQSYYIDLQPIGAINNYQQVAFKVI